MSANPKTAIFEVICAMKGTDSKFHDAIEDVTFRSESIRGYQKALDTARHLMGSFMLRMGGTVIKIRHTTNANSYTSPIWVMGKNETWIEHRLVEPKPGVNHG